MIFWNPSQQLSYDMKISVKSLVAKSLSRVWLFVIPWTVAYQAPPSMGFSRQEYWSGLPFPSPGYLPSSGIEPGSPALQADALTSEPPGKPGGKVIGTTDSNTSLICYLCLQGNLNYSLMLLTIRMYFYPSKLIYFPEYFHGPDSSVQSSHSVVSDSLRPHELQHARPPCPSPAPGVYSNSCPSSIHHRWPTVGRLVGGFPEKENQEWFSFFFLVTMI